MSEDQLHNAVADFLTLVIAPAGLTRDGVMWRSTELRNAKSAAEGANRKRRGCVAGQPDIDLVDNGKLFGIELKTANGRKSAAQKEAHPELEAAGVPVKLCRSVADVAAALRDWGIPHRRVS